MREIPIHGGVSNWYIDVLDPPKSFQVEIGYVAPGDRFFCLARSNTVTTPRAGSGDAFDHNWSEVAKDSDRIYAMSAGYPEQEANRELKEVFEERLRRPMGDPMSTQFGVGAGGAGAERADMKFHVDTELIIHGVAQPDAHVMLKGEPVHLRPDGTFAVRCNLPDRRHVLPVVASSPDGVEQRTIVLASKLPERLVASPGADRKHQVRALFELPGQRERKVIGCRGNDDGIKGSMFLPAPIAIGSEQMDILVAQFVEPRLGRFGQFRDDLNGIDLGDNLS